MCRVGPVVYAMITPAIDIEWHRSSKNWEGLLRWSCNLRSRELTYQHWSAHWSRWELTVHEHQKSDAWAADSWNVRCRCSVDSAPLLQNGHVSSSNTLMFNKYQASELCLVRMPTILLHVLLLFNFVRMVLTGKVLTGLAAFRFFHLSLWETLSQF